MNRIRHSSRQLLARAVLIAVISMVGGDISIAFAQMAQYSTPQQQSIPTPQSQPAQTETVRPEIAMVVMAVQELMSTQKFQEALAKVREADRVADRTAFEDFVLDQIRGLAAARAGDLPTATKSYEAVVASGRLARTDQLKVVELLAQLYFEAKDYPKSATWSARYVTEGGTDPQRRLLRVRSLYLAEDFAGAAAELRASVAADEKAGIAPPLSRLQLLASCYVKLKDDAGYVSTLEKFLAYDKGLALMEQGMQKGGIARLDDAKLHLAIAYLAGGQKAKATAMFKEVQGSDGAADLAHLWLIQAQRS